MTEHRLNRFTENILKALKSAGRDFTDHSIFSPSGSSMWAYCSGALIPNLFAADKSGEDAAYGTVGHGVGERWLKTGERPDDLLGTVETVGEFQIEIDQSMLDYVSEYVDWCINLPGVHFVETRVDHSDLTPLKKQGGTADHAACAPGHLILTDLKLGKGVQVFAKNNTQGIIYIYGFFKKYDELFDFEKFTFRIAQPRLHHFDEWTFDREELLKWAAWLKERAYAAWCENAERTPGPKQCQWCKIQTDCAAYAVFVERASDGVFDDLDAPITTDDMAMLAHRLDTDRFEIKPITVGRLTIEQKVKLSRYRKMIENFFAAIQADIEERALRGEHIPGKKVVEGKSNRVFVSPSAAVQQLEFLGLDYDDICPRGMIGITETEGRLVKLGYRRNHLPDLLKSVVRKPNGKPTVVDEDDPRPPLETIIGNTFDNLDEDL
jgi:hypothetical protein